MIQKRIHIFVTGRVQGVFFRQSTRVIAIKNNVNGWVRNLDDGRVEIVAEGEKQNIGPFSHGSAVHTDIMKTQALKQALDKYGFDVAFGGARRDEEKARAKERVFSVRDDFGQWDPKNQRPELWNLFNGRKNEGLIFINLSSILKFW